MAITGDAESTLGKYADVTLCIGKISEACPLGVAPSVSTTCMLALGDALALTTMKSRAFGVEDYARFHPAGAVGRKLLTVEQPVAPLVPMVVRWPIDGSAFPPMGWAHGSREVPSSR